MVLAVVLEVEKEEGGVPSGPCISCCLRLICCCSPAFFGRAASPPPPPPPPSWRLPLAVVGRAIDGPCRTAVDAAAAVGRDVHPAAADAVVGAAARRPAPAHTPRRPRRGRRHHHDRVRTHPARAAAAARTGACHDGGRARRRRRRGGARPHPPPHSLRGRPSTRLERRRPRGAHPPEAGAALFSRLCSGWIGGRGGRGGGGARGPRLWRPLPTSTFAVVVIALTVHSCCSFQPSCRIAHGGWDLPGPPSTERQLSLSRRRILAARSSVVRSDCRLEPRGEGFATPRPADGRAERKETPTETVVQIRGELLTVGTLVEADAETNARL